VNLWIKTGRKPRDDRRGSDLGLGFRYLRDGLVHQVNQVTVLRVPSSGDYRDEIDYRGRCFFAKRGITEARGTVVL
jgi:hypothetical protein